MSIVIPEQDKFENLDDSSRISVDETTGLARRLGRDGKPTGDPKPLAELLKEAPEEPKPNPRKFSTQAKKDQNLA